MNLLCLLMLDLLGKIPMAMEDIGKDIENMAGVTMKELLDSGLFDKKHAKRWVVKKKYFELAKTGRTYIDIKNELSDKYEISVSTIERIVYNR